MSPWLLACLMASFVAAWVPAVHTQGVTEDCCLGYTPHLRRSLFRKIRSFYWQEVSGSCNLRAVIFELQESDRVVCGNPRDKIVRKAIEFLSKSRRKVSNSTATPALQAPGKKVHPGAFKRPWSRLKQPMGNRKNAGPLVTKKRINSRPVIGYVAPIWQVAASPSE